MVHNIFSGNLEAHFQVSDAELFQLYLTVAENNPKPQQISKSLHLTCLSLTILELIGKNIPTQPEIDCIELSLKRYSKRKSINCSFNYVAKSNHKITHRTV